MPTARHKVRGQEMLLQVALGGRQPLGRESGVGQAAGKGPHDFPELDSPKEE